MTKMAGQGLAWRKSSHSSANGDCVEVAWPSRVLVRDSKQAEVVVLAFSTGQWRSFLASVG